jgi:hypothetical protein
MSNAIQSEMILPPTSVTNTATSTSSTAAISLGQNDAGGWYSFVAKTADGHILFGRSDVAAATTANALYMAIGARYDYYIPVGYATHFRFIASATGVISWARSGP